MSNEQPNVRLQNLRDFTVQIRHGKTDAIVGTGLVVSVDKVVTCAHVVVAAGVNPRLGTSIPGIRESIFGRTPGTLADAKDAEVGVYFPQARDGEIKERRATVAACFLQHDDDIVLLKLDGGPAPLGPEQQMARLGPATESARHDFQTFGYRRLEKYSGLPGGGRIEGFANKPTDGLLYGDPIMLDSKHIDSGMSGAAVLDIEQDLVVGVIAETWDSKGFADRDTNFAVDARVLTFDPFGLTVQVQSLDQRPAQRPKTDIAVVRAAVAPDLGISLNGAPVPLRKWVGREELLRAITSDWADPNCRVTGLIGFAGEGKSSLARRWLDNLLTDELQLQPDGLFWWSFSEKPNPDEFFEAALTYMSGGHINPREYPSANARAHFIAGMLTKGCNLFILDGLEVMQYQDGDQHGLLKSADLARFLGFFAAPGHQSFCLITSRAPIIDLIDYTTYTHHDVDRLSLAEGRDLLRRLGARGPNEKMGKVVEDWGGHALMLSLLGAYVVNQHKGDLASWHKHVKATGDIPLLDEPHYELVHRLLHRYDVHLSEIERTFLMLLSAFRTPIDETAFDKVFRAPIDARAAIWSPLHTPIAALDDTTFNSMVRRLMDYRILRYDPETRQYTTHPLIRDYYYTHLTSGDRAQAQAMHQCIKDFYLAVARDIPKEPKLDDLTDLIEAVHHACCAGAYDEGCNIFQDRLFVPLTQTLGAYETALDLLREFFLNGDTSQEPRVSYPSQRFFILVGVGLCLTRLGRCREALPICEWALAGYLADETMALPRANEAIAVYLLLTELHINLGAFSAGEDTVSKALTLARRTENKEGVCNSVIWQAWAAHLRGELHTAHAVFDQAVTLARIIDSNKRYLFARRGIFHADHLRRTSDTVYAGRITRINLGICKHNHLCDHTSRCHCILGDLDADAGLHHSAREHYAEALRIARGISRRDVLIEALLARGRWYARHMKDASAAFSDLNEALGYAVQGGYRIYEADIRIGLAWAHLTPGPSPERRGEIDAARAEAEYAQRMSQEMGYHWGQVDAEEVLQRMRDEG